MAMTKSEARGAAQGRASERRKAAAARPMAAAATIGGAWIGQKYLGSGTPGMEQWPLTYAVGGGLMLASMFGPLKRDTAMNRTLYNAAVGIVAGQLAIEGAKNPSPLFGG